MNYIPNLKIGWCFLTR